MQLSFDVFIGIYRTTERETFAAQKEVIKTSIDIDIIIRAYSLLMTHQFTSWDHRYN